MDQVRIEEARDRIDYPHVRAELARRKVTRVELAALSGLNESYISIVLSECRIPGELFRIKICRALAKLGIEPLPEETVDVGEGQ